MQFDQMNSNLNASSNANDSIIKPKLIKKSNVSTQKVEETKGPAPSASSAVGYEFTLNGQSLNNVEEKVAHLSLQMNQIIVRPYLQQALDYLRTSKRDSINAYNQLSDQIANEIRIISQNCQQISVSLKEAQEVVAKTQEIIRNKYNNAIEEDISSGALNLDYEYNIVAEHYELSLQLTQELSRYKARIDTLLSTQSMLDESIVPPISRLQLEIDNLELLLQCFDSSDYAQMLAKKTGTNISSKKVRSNDFQSRTEEISKLAAAASANSMEALQNQNNINNNNISSNNMNGLNNPNLSNLSRNDTVNNQRINTSNYAYGQQNQQNNGALNNNQYGLNAYSNAYSNNNLNATNNANSINNQQQMNNNQQAYQPLPEGLSRQELKMMKKLREQQMKFEHMMKMNELIFQYNRSVDEMILRQKEYELKHQKEFEEARKAMGDFGISSNGSLNNTSYKSKKITEGDLDLYGSKHVYETSMPMETLADNMKRSTTDKVFVVRQAEPITEDQAREIKNRGSVKSIKVVKKNNQPN